MNDLEKKLNEVIEELQQAKNNLTDERKERDALLNELEALKESEALLKEKVEVQAQLLEEGKSSVLKEIFETPVKKIIKSGTTSAWLFFLLGFIINVVIYFLGTNNQRNLSAIRDFQEKSFFFDLVQSSPNQFRSVELSIEAFYAGDSNLEEFKYNNLVHAIFHHGNDVYKYHTTNPFYNADLEMYQLFSAAVKELDRLIKVKNDSLSNIDELGLLKLEDMGNGRYNLPWSQFATNDVSPYVRNYGFPGSTLVDLRDNFKNQRDIRKSRIEYNGYSVND